MLRRPPISTLFPYTRSSDLAGEHERHARTDRALGAAAVGRREDLLGRHVRDVLDPGLGESGAGEPRSEEHTSELQSRQYLVCRLLLEKKKTFEKTQDSQTVP